MSTRMSNIERQGSRENRVREAGPGGQTGSRYYTGLPEAVSRQSKCRKPVFPRSKDRVTNLYRAAQA